MDLFSRYLFRQLAASFLLIVATLTTIIWLASALARLELMTTEGQSLVLLLKMTTLALPALVAIIAPIALLVACLYTFDRLSGDSELIIMSAAGAPIWRFAYPCLALAGLLSVIVLIFNLFVTPASLRELRAHINQVRTDLIAQVLQPGRFSSPEKGLTFHIRDRALNGELIGLIIHDSRAQNQIMTYLADRGQIITNDDGSYMVMRDGHIHRQESGKQDDSVQIVAFEQYIFDITQYGPKSGAGSLRHSELYPSELLNPDPKNPHYINSPGRFGAEIHDRVSSALYPIVYVMIVLNFMGNPTTVRENRWTSAALAFGTAVLLRAGGVVSTNLMTLNPPAIVLVYGIPIGAIIVAGFTASVRMAPYTRLRISLDASAKLQMFNDKMMAVLGVKTEQNGGSVG
ncbi:MAG: LPS export ABC transporter permease LptF [Hyphomicrobiaceae bacterium]|nr:LPS export ABC transporter permease LptF [Hyphomicrobiaceae bacterium]